MKPKSKLLGKKDGYFQKAAKKFLLCITGTHIANIDNTPKLLSINFQDKVQFQLLGETQSPPSIILLNSYPICYHITDLLLGI